MPSGTQTWRPAGFHHQHSLTHAAGLRQRTDPPQTLDRCPSDWRHVLQPRLQTQQARYDRRRRQAAEFLGDSAKTKRVWAVAGCDEGGGRVKNMAEVTRASLRIETVMLNFCHDWPSSVEK